MRRPYVDAFDTWTPGHDLLIRDPNAELAAGCLDELSAVLHLSEKHAVVTPRTDSAPFFALASHKVWEKLRDTLPRYQILPAAGAFCLLIRSEVLERFGFLEASFASRQDQVHDFICRINRYGYSALLANWAFAFYPEPAPARDYTRNAVLTERYPEFDRRIADYWKFQAGPLESFAVLYEAHRPRILYDLSHLGSHHSGTSDLGLNLLRELAPLLREEYELVVGAGDEQSFFLPELRGYELYDMTSGAPLVFDLVFKPSHVFRWVEFVRMNRLAPRVAFTLLDMIALRCDYIGNASVQNVVRESVERSDLVFAISEFTRADFSAFYAREKTMPVIALASLLNPPQANPPGEYLLIMGNALEHKGVAGAVEHLQGAWPIVVLGGQEKQQNPNVRWLASGLLSRRAVYELLLHARLLVYLSHYEGFGLPVADALAMGKPVVALDTAVNREMARDTGDPNLHLIPSSKELRSAVHFLWDTPPHPANRNPRRWADAAREYLAAFRELLSKDIDIEKLRRRWEVVHRICSQNDSRSAN